MIRRLIKKIFGKGNASPSPKPRSKSTAKPSIIRKSKHGISREQASTCALRVVDELQSAGFSAFIVGGAVRDLLLGRQPKDYDIATSATPDQVRGHFRR